MVLIGFSTLERPVISFDLLTSRVHGYTLTNDDHTFAAAELVMDFYSRSLYFYVY